MANHLHPLEPPYPPETAALLAGYPQADGQLLSLFRTFAHSPRFLKKGVPNLLDRDSPLPLRIREIVILRVTALRSCDYEWGVHTAIFAGAARIDAAQLADTRATAINPALWSADEACLLHALDQLCRDGRLDDATQARFEADWSLAQQLEVCALAGAYQTVSFVANLARLPHEAFSRPPA
ncbi:carboxymuconolactone decarboxylase family protein [Sandarakinorhabdus oryzae]|uniref:carboxymuconolactone decarboxylase family protein n=1 Tax=Sandarakinorhabdus oryzae TaxID=2675220 RepID=UPI0018CC7756|nr:carboxymuconolactone decarboxylase family protein [Sandarakinorhabdus oryzae]